ncbi:MAG: fused MFS/spermidine synthase [Bacteroidetes bacterium]|nr:fused MFS/spermidine synthase [Bacteroidota bacterium]
MAIELCGARLLSPIYGTSLYVWSSVLALTLAGLATGYFFGAFLSLKENTKKVLQNVIALACICIALIPFLAHYIIPRISYLNFNFAVILSTALLIFLPLACLGCTSPLFIKIISNNVNAGKYSGTVYGVSTLGGILSTFISGFFIIPNFGFNVTIISFSLFLYFVTILTLKQINWFLLLVFVFAIYISVFISNKNSNLLFSKNGLNGTVNVAEYQVSNQTIRLLSINNIIQTEYNLTTKTSSSNYLKLIENEVEEDSLKGKVLILGLGGGILSNILINKGYEVKAIEFDKTIIDCAKNYFNLNSKTVVIEDDARNYINKCDEKFQYIIFDLFKSEECPSHVVTIESLNKIKNIINPNGKVFVNWHGYYKNEIGKGTLTLINTFKAAGFDVNLKSTSLNEAHSNLVFKCNLNDKIKANPYFEINSDNFQILEKQNALASLQWRKNYLNYYQSNK